MDKRSPRRQAQDRALAESLGSEQAVDDLRRQAAELRERNGACLHGDDEREYQNEQECDDDDSPLVICSKCGREKLRVAVILTAPLEDNEDRAALDAFKTGLLRGGEYGA